MAISLRRQLGGFKDKLQKDEVRHELDLQNELNMSQEGRRYSCT
jgi:hypothetical protein